MRSSCCCTTTSRSSLSPEWAFPCIRSAGEFAWAVARQDSERRGTAQRFPDRVLARAGTARMLTSAPGIVRVLKGTGTSDPFAIGSRTPMLGWSLKRSRGGSGRARLGSGGDTLGDERADVLSDADMVHVASTCRVRPMPDRRQRPERRYTGSGGRRANDVRPPWTRPHHGPSPDRQTPSEEPTLRGS